MKQKIQITGMTQYTERTFAGSCVMWGSGGTEDDGVLTINWTVEVHCFPNRICIQVLEIERNLLLI